ncbi:MAG: hypothetical protein LH617_10985 [Ramlibacter sp.]|nr:hypothetical protein [Ramlibacter sp.]
MKTLLVAALTFAVLHGAGPAAHAAAFRIDETGTVVSDPVINMKWRTPSAGSRVLDNTVEATLRVDVRLNLAPWINQQSRIYMVLAPVNSDRVRARWTTQGRLLPGTVTSGERALVYQGPAGPAALTESLLLTLETDGQRLTQQQTLNFHFEIEVGP